MIKVEVCAASVEDCRLAQVCKADRIELNSALHLGGLTPSYGLVKQSLSVADLAVLVMIRPRGGGFCYSEQEYSVMLEDAKMFLSMDIAGLVFGFLNENREVDRERTRLFTDLCHSHGKEAVFHRAFDVCEDPHRATQTLISLQVDRILTSGQQETAIQGADLLSLLQLKYGDSIEFCVGSGVNADNARNLVEQTGIHQLHGSFKKWSQDPTTSTTSVSYSYSEKGSYDGVDKIALKQMIESIKDSR